MPTYETLYITQPEMAEADAEALGKSFEELLETGEGTLMKSVAWGKRKLAYLVKKHQEGLYFYMQFDVAPDVVAELERRLASGATSELILSGEFYTDPEPVDELPEDLLLALAPSDWLETFASSNATQDYRTELGALSDSERMLFVQLLEEYARDEMQGQPPAREG